jgi:hypothetical protein
MACLEAPTGAERDIDLSATWAATGTQNVLIDDEATTLVIANGDWTLGSIDHYAATIGTMHDIGDTYEYFYLVNGSSGEPGTYATGKFVITVEGVAVPKDGS